MSDAPVAGADLAKRAVPRWMKWLLIASLAFNVLIIGAIASRAWHGARGGFAGPGAGMGPSIGVFTARLSSERRQAVWAAIREERQALRPLREEARTARQAVRAALAAEPFDGRQLAEAQTRLLEAEVKVRAASQRLIGSIAAVLNADERRQFSAHIMAEGARGGRMGPGSGFRGRHEGGVLPEGDGPTKDAGKPQR
ncbi:MAG: periplasmic heavy metal sensor [Hyphomicrobiaceae bacterium]